MIHAPQLRKKSEMGRDMNSRPLPWPCSVMVWHLPQTRVNVFVSQDMLRLFAAEVASAGVPARDLLQLARQNKDGANADMAPPADFSASSDPLKKFEPRLPLMVSYLSEFMEKNSFSGVSLVNTDILDVLAPDGVQPPDDRATALFCRALDSKEPVLMPVRRENGKLVMDMAFPILYPLYVDSTGDRVVSLLLATYSVLPVTAAATGEAGNGSQYNTFILQSFGEKLQRIAPTEVSGVSDLDGWSL